MISFCRDLYWCIWRVNGLEEVPSHNLKSQVTNFQMPSNEISVDVLRDILDYVNKAGLATMCRVNKICCSCSQDVLYRDIYALTRRANKVQQTLAQSTQLARRVRSFESNFEDSDLATALRNMTSLRILKLSDAFYVDARIVRMQVFR